MFSGVFTSFRLSWSVLVSLCVPFVTSESELSVVFAGMRDTPAGLVCQKDVLNRRETGGEREG